MASREDNQTDVVEHMASDARTHGANALCRTSRTGPRTTPRKSSLSLVSPATRNVSPLALPEIRDAIHSQGAFISRLDGEWCLRFA